MCSRADVDQLVRTLISRDVSPGSPRRGRSGGADLMPSCPTAVTTAFKAMLADVVDTGADAWTSGTRHLSDGKCPKRAGVGSANAWARDWVCSFTPLGTPALRAC
jgi:hypothetical protein